MVKQPKKPILSIKTTQYTLADMSPDDISTIFQNFSVQPDSFLQEMENWAIHLLKENNLPHEDCAYTFWKEGQAIQYKKISKSLDFKKHKNVITLKKLILKLYPNTPLVIQLAATQIMNVHNLKQSLQKHCPESVMLNTAHCVETYINARFHIFHEDFTVSGKASHDGGKAGQKKKQSAEQGLISDRRDEIQEAIKKYLQKQPQASHSQISRAFIKNPGRYALHTFQEKPLQDRALRGLIADIRKKLAA